MSAWWSGLSQTNQAFYCVAAFFSVFFLWQLIAAFIGLGHDGSEADMDAGDVDTGGDMDHSYDHVGHDVETDSSATVAAFKLLSIRSIITFLTLFSWGTALYLNRGDPLGRSMGVSTIWGLAGMASVAFVLSMLPRLAHTGNKQIATSVGARGTVYLNIAAGGLGEVRVLVSGVVSYIKARSANGEAIKAGTVVRVTRVLDNTTVEVEVETGREKGGDQ